MAAREAFLSSGGYHGGGGRAPTPSERRAAREAAAAKKAAKAGAAGAEADTSPVVMGGADAWGAEGAEAEESEESEDDDGGELLSWEEEAQRREVEPDGDLRWLRERGHGAAAAQAALATVRRLSSV